MIEQDEIIEYNSLNEIRLRKELLRKDIQADDAKIKALSMYRGVMRPYPHPRSAEYITGLAAVRGGQWGVNYAEAFEVVQREY